MKDLDLVLQGATGFTGRLAAAELARAAPPGLRWGVCGRTRERVEAIAERYGAEALVADAHDAEALARVAQRARVVISCAGPFTELGTPLLAACVEHGAHYADLSGELGWIWQMIQQYHTPARERGVVLLPCSGFDSVPSDLAVLTMLRLLRERGQEAGALTGFFRLKGGLNGGTLASGIAQYERWSVDDLSHPFLLDPDPEASWQQRLLPPPTRPVFRVPALRGYAAPFVMAEVNERIVRRSAALAESGNDASPYGPDFTYGEHLVSSSRKQANAFKWGDRLARWALATQWTRNILRKRGPKPGEGPSERQRTEGFVELTLLAGDLAEPDARLDWFFPGDPGNTVTVRCLVQVGLALAADEARDAGLLTPAHALGSRLVERLRTRDALLDAPAG